MRQRLGMYWDVYFRINIDSKTTNHYMCTRIGHRVQAAVKTCLKYNETF